MAFGGIDSVKVENLKETRRALRKMDKGLAREFNKSLKVVVTETKDEAKSKADGVYRPSHASRGIKGTFVGNKGVITLDTRSQPTIAGNEFGGGAHGRGNPTSRGGYTSQFRPWRGSGADAGYAVFPTIRRRTGINRDLVERQITTFIRKNDL